MRQDSRSRYHAPDMQYCELNACMTLLDASDQLPGAGEDEYGDF